MAEVTPVPTNGAACRALSPAKQSLKTRVLDRYASICSYVFSICKIESSNVYIELLIETTDRLKGRKGYRIAGDVRNHGSQPPFLI